VHLPREGGIGFFFDAALQRRNHTVHQTAYSSSAEDVSKQKAASGDQDDFRHDGRP